ncbi:MAG TPA: aminomethyl-transferring glycine dehydrogenase [Bacteroidales bacterium]|nr:aminomethyl-transferring glycine dehydrogenase [Bacteroidales bacterium]
MITNNFVKRHNGPRGKEIEQMLQKIGVSSIDELIDQTIPQSIRLKNPMNLPEGMNEYEFLNHLKDIASRNKIYKNFIGLGYYGTITPGVITRNILENPGWYTSYTPYQAEISQGRLEALLNYQTVISDLTAMPIANASLLDEGTAAAEAMIMFFNGRSRDQVKNNANKFFVSKCVFPQTYEVLKTRSKPLGIELVIGNFREINLDNTFFGALLQYPTSYGKIFNYAGFVEQAHSMNVHVAVATDLLSLTMLTPPGEWGADAVLGSTQRFGLPMGYGGPHAGFFAVNEKFKRNIPGRIIGVSVDANGSRAYRMALQTREQHIKRERATSNICTAQALLAIMSGMYAVYHGPAGLKEIARHINILTGVLSSEIQKYGYTQENEFFFDTLKIKLPDHVKITNLRNLMLENKINLRYIDEKSIGVSIDETTHLNDINLLLSVFANAAGMNFTPFVCNQEACRQITTIPSELRRTSPYLEQSVFNSYHSETEMMRYIKKLEVKDLSLNRAMIPLGSCTMKLNAGAEMFALSWPEFGNVHPFVPADQAEGYLYLIKELEKALCEITGFSAISFQPNSGAAGEYAGLMVIRQYHASCGQQQRDVVLIPASAHGTNPASAVMAGFKVVVVKCDDHGNIDTNDLREKAVQHKDTLAALMVTYPSTHGVFEENILEIVDIIHQHGGQVYMDGANMNAQVGFTSPARIGADVCHLNLHKTFAIPHGGGGPGVGPIGVAGHLVEFLPQHVFCGVLTTKNGITAVSSAPFGSAMVLTISYAYIKLMGGAGLSEATRFAILNANYLKSCLENHYPILYAGSKGRVAHEMILDCNDIDHKTGIGAIDIAKRLMDYGFHAPTVAFPVHGTLMVEPTESEPFSELNRLVDAMISIREEIAEIESGKADKTTNVIKKAPHTAIMIAADDWNLPYSRMKAAFPMPWSANDKYWPAVTRIDDAFGDRNLVCVCEPIESYKE